MTAEECQQIADTFWSGTGPEFKPNATYAYESCKLDAFYSGQLRHAFYSLDESGHFQLRAPMEYLTQVAASFENASIIQLDARASNIRNAQCNASPSRAIIDTPLIADTHTTSCTWWTSDGAAIPTTDEPLIEGDIEDFFYTYDVGTNGPFIDMTLPINPFTPPQPTNPQPEETPPRACSSASAPPSPSCSWWAPGPWWWPCAAHTNHKPRSLHTSLHTPEEETEPIRTHLTTATRLQRSLRANTPISHPRAHANTEGRTQPGAALTVDSQTTTGSPVLARIT